MRFLWINFLAFSALSTAHAQSPTFARLDGFEIRRAVQRFYIQTQLEPVAVVRAERIYRGCERKGFFRIGILPIVALDGVCVEIPNPGLVTNALAQLQTWMCSHGKNSVELRRLKFQVGAPPASRVESGRALVGRKGQWELDDGVSFYSGTNQMHAARAALRLTGENAGGLILNTTPPFATNLFFSCTPVALSLTTKKDTQ